MLMITVTSFPRSPSRSPQVGCQTLKPYSTRSARGADVLGGAHEQLLGSNRGGLRSAQAARYPQALCAAICSGVEASDGDRLRFEHVIP